jgi:ribonuclease HI
VGGHDPLLPKRTLVAFVVEESAKLQGVGEVVDASETDDAELAAILFAMRALKGKLKRYTIICDHESVVSETKKKKAAEMPDTNPRLREVWAELKANRSIKVEFFGSNPAHRLLNRYLREEKDVLLQL